MTARFDRLGKIDGAILASMLATMAVFSFPTTADASVTNKTSLVFEIKIQTLKMQAIPMTQLTADTESVAKDSTPTPTVQVASKSTFTTSAGYQLPPKKIGAERVYMHEPEIRAYLCPKLGDKCNIFMAVLAAENGTHECTRDNRGLNRNGTVDIGLAQINWSPSSPYSFEQLQDCKFNLDIAMKKYDARGFQPWAAYTSGRYLKHLPAILASAKALEAASAINATVAPIPADPMQTAVALSIN